MGPTAFPEIELILKEENEIRALAQHGSINYLKTFELHRFVSFLENIKLYNSRFLKPRFYPEKNGKTKFISSSFHSSHWAILVKPSTWIALSQVNPRVDEKIQALRNHWAPRIMRALPRSEELVSIIENNELVELEKFAKAAWQEVQKKKITDVENKAIYEQILFYLKPFIDTHYFRSEKNRVLNDLLARIHVSSHSEDSSVDDVVHYVLACLDQLGVADQLKRKEAKKETHRFLKNPHYCGMTEALFSKIIHLIETHGSKRQILSLHRLPIFKENTTHFPTKNIWRKNHTFAVPFFLIDQIPRFKPWPAWIFPNRYFRYQYFRKKQALLHILKTCSPRNTDAVEITSIDQSTLEKMRKKLSVLKKEAEKVSQEIANVKSAESKKFLEKWQGALLELKNEMEQNVSAETEILQSMAITIPASPSLSHTHETLNMNDSSIKVKSFTALGKKQKKILDLFFCLHSQKNMGHFTLKKVSNLLRIARFSLLETEDFFNHECRRYLNPHFFSSLGGYLIEQSRRGEILGDPDTSRLLISCFSDYFSLSTEPRIQEYQFDFDASFRKILIQQLKVLCERIVQDYSLNDLSCNKISNYQAYLNSLLKIADEIPRLHNFVSALAKEILLIKNPHLLEVKCRAILEGISTDRLSPPTLLWKNSDSKHMTPDRLPSRLAEGASL